MAKYAFTALFTLFAAQALAAPSANPIEKRTPGGIYICTDINWSGECGYKVQPLNTCIHLDDPWYHTISSFGPDQGTSCQMYSDKNCNFPIGSGIGYPGVADMTKDGLNDQVGAFKCHT
ncbi:hypothetical protein NA57DRAFT_54528 [Rhizodiscina lignyota]|uniref:Uncharacterized protein n=1 Tax=Rhizodiscina lignyota TaxID=1504668 RepID=A0A9P4IGA0_9PEZI|nr:hypothetical protein NA57DRAFT_54528 [Rhizodiscina lignyota]